MSSMTREAQRTRVLEALAERLASATSGDTVDAHKLTTMARDVAAEAGGHESPLRGAVQAMSFLRSYLRQTSELPPGSDQDHVGEPYTTFAALESWLRTVAGDPKRVERVVRAAATASAS